MGSGPLMFGDSSAEMHAALSRLNGGVFVMTSAHDGQRAGVVVKSAMLCSDEPPMVCVAAWKGHGLEPIVRDSGRFALCQIDAEDKLVIRKFSGHVRDNGDQFDSLPIESLATGSPVLKRCILALDCEVVRHWDIEADHELYVGLVRAGRVYGFRAGAQNVTPIPRAAS